MAQKTFNNTKINVEFEPTSNRQQLTSGDALPTLFGKISKIITDLKPFSFSGSSDDLPTIPATKGGSGKTTLVDSANAYINALTEGTSTPTDNDYMITQYASGGTTNTTYHRRKMSTVFEYFKGKFDSIYAALNHSHSSATTSESGFMSSTDKSTLNRLNKESLSLVPRGTSIASNKDLNTIDFIKVGKYFCSTNAIAATLTNCPVVTGFMMEVYSPLSTTYDNETTTAYVYRVRKIMTYTGAEYTQSVSSSATAGTFTYGTWRRTDTDTTYTLDSITGTLPVSKGGTGATTAKGAEYAILGAMPESTAALTDNAIAVFKKTSPNATDGVTVYKKMSLFWNYIQDKIKNILGLTATNYSGTSAKATADASGNNIVNTYATIENAKKVTQSVSDVGEYRALLMGTTANATPSNLGTEVDGIARINTGIYAQPSTATIFAKKFSGDLAGNATPINNLLATTTGKPLDATQGKILNDKFGGLTFGQDAEGNWGYKPSGADSVIPFKSGNLVEENLVSYFPSLYSAKSGTSITATVTSDPIDFTDISFLRFNYTNTAKNRPKYNITIGSITFALSPSSNTLMVDVRSITGEQTITFTLTDSFTSSFTGSTMINSISAIKIGELQNNNTSPAKLLPGIRIYKHENGNAYAFTTIDISNLNTISYTCSTTNTTYIKVKYEDGTSPTLSTTGVLDVSGHSSMEIKTYANSTTYRYFTITDYS